MFSIITVTYNNLEGLIKTSQSVMEQTFEDFEWIVVDGGSTDGTVQFLRSFDRRKIKWLSENDNGIYDAMNKGLRLSCRDYCIFMNAGDRFYDPSVLMEVSSAIDLDRPCIVYGDSCEATENKRWYKPARSPRSNFYVMFTHHQAIFYLRKELGSGYDLSYRFSADWALTTRILNNPTAQILHYPRTVCLFERGGVSQRHAHRKEINAEHWRIYTQESKMNLPLAAVLWVVKVGTNTVRRYLPKLYDVIRYSRSA
jgi:putative colanic acid biosynthesis glycosyltransferase